MTQGYTTGVDRPQTRFRVHLDRFSFNTRQAKDDLMVAAIKLFHEFEGHPNMLAMRINQKKLFRLIPLPYVSLYAEFDGRLDPERDTRSRATNTLNRTGVGWFVVWEA